MINKCKKIESDYFGLFSERGVAGKFQTFKDEETPSMYSHNFSYLEHFDLSEEEVIALLEERVKELQNTEEFAKLVTHPSYEVKSETIDYFKKNEYRVEELLNMILPVEKLASINENEQIVVIRSETDAEKEMAIQYIEEMESIDVNPDFAKEKCSKKVKVYKKYPEQIVAYMATLNGAPVGFCEWYIQDEIVSISDFVTTEKYRGQGFGATMIKKMVQDAEKLGAKYIYLTTDKHDKAKNLYSRLGFETIGEELHLLKKW